MIDSAARYSVLLTTFQRKILDKLVIYSLYYFKRVNNLNASLYILERKDLHTHYHAIGPML